MSEKKANAEIRCCCGRMCLFINGFAVAVEGYQCYDSELLQIKREDRPDYRGWTKKRMEAVLTAP